MYKLTTSSTRIIRADGAIIPADYANTDYIGYLAWLAKGNTVQPADVPPAPTAIDKIRELEAKHEDDQRKLNRQAAIDTALTIACRHPKAAGKTRDEVHAIYYATHRGYRAMVDIEAQIVELRKQIP
ncbi:MAG: hypothetical protein ACK5A0_04640 [Polaromonas sp.]